MQGMSPRSVHNVAAHIGTAPLRAIPPAKLGFEIWLDRIRHLRQQEGSRAISSQLAALANAGHQLFDSLFPRKLLGLELIPFKRARFGHGPIALGRAIEAVISAGAAGSIVRVTMAGVATPRAPLRSLEFGTDRHLSRRPSRKARTHSDQQKSVA